VRTARDAGGRAVAVLPLYRARRGPLRVVRMIGHGVADQLAPVCAPDDRPAAARALRQVLDDPGDPWHVALLDRLPGEDDWPGLLGDASVERRESSPVLDAGGATFDEWLRSQSRNFREQVRRRERRLVKSHDVAFELCDDPDRFDDDYDTLVRLHRARFGDQSRSFDPPRDALHREFGRHALERGWLRLWTLRVDGRAAAAWLGYRMGGCEWYYQAGREPDFERESVGFVLMVHTIREALDAGMREYRLLLGDEPYKARFANADHGLDTVMYVRGPAGRAARAIARRPKVLPRPLRDRVRRLAG
jgi:CelD/BcsL family acetyltransferase involved in cellulose biosynthesis